MNVSVEDKLAVNKYDLDEEVHISVREDICADCERKPCLYVCPAECYRIRNERFSFAYEGCLECGSCQLVCPSGAIDWKLPRGGLGICYQFG